MGAVNVGGVEEGDAGVDGVVDELYHVRFGLGKANMPRFHPENVKHNAKLYEQVSEMAARKGCTTAQIALAWLHQQGSDVCPIPGTTKIENFNKNIEALSVKLTPEELTQLEPLAASVKGERYGPNFASWRNSETPPLSSWKAE
ncbi:hypothetical protein RJ640_022463 [Escallonia rubra]|uniref:NADP-dependent oxidoreductase domain-containing protein n=1 Tax=Escallonia rubra TaxID=112253 RepID=A0AA88QDN5_9ASTE|nr:hypothetical protein RJ640_022463 [Escallonia rubra]